MIGTCGTKNLASERYSSVMWFWLLKVKYSIRIYNSTLKSHRKFLKVMEFYLKIKIRNRLESIFYKSKSEFDFFGTWFCNRKIFFIDTDQNFKAAKSKLHEVLIWNRFYFDFERSKSLVQQIKRRRCGVAHQMKNMTDVTVMVPAPSVFWLF